MNLITENFGKKLAGPVNKRLRSWAIERAEKNILESGKDIRSFSEEELEVVVCEEEEKLKSTIKNYGIGALTLALFGTA